MEDLGKYIVIKVTSIEGTAEWHYYYLALSVKAALEKVKKDWPQANRIFGNKISFGLLQLSSSAKTRAIAWVQNHSTTQTDNEEVFFLASWPRPGRH